MIFGFERTSLKLPFSEYTSPDFGSTSVIFTEGGSRRWGSLITQVCAETRGGRADEE